MCLPQKVGACDGGLRSLLKSDEPHQNDKRLLLFFPLFFVYIHTYIKYEYGLFPVAVGSATHIMSFFSLFLDGNKKWDGVALD